MKIKEISKKDIEEFLFSEYGIKPLEIIYIPVGEIGASYRVITKYKDYYIKIYKKREESPIKSNQIYNIVNFLFIINNRFKLKNTPVPIKNKKNKLLSRLNNHDFVVFYFIRGKHLKKLTGKNLKSLGKSISQIHSLDKTLFKNIFNEKTDPELEHHLLTIISDIKKNDNENKFIKQLKQEILKNEELLLKTCRLIEETIPYIKNKINQYVIVHSDLHPGNFLKDKKEIYILDWDYLELALPEKDLMFFLEDYNLDDTFFNSYLKNKHHSLDKKTLNYYLLKRFIFNIFHYSKDVLGGRLHQRIIERYLGIAIENMNSLRKFIISSKL